jgi:hypothetical protein
VDIDFTVGDYVLTARQHRHKDKTRPIWDGPARVIEQINDRVFKVQDLGSEHISELHATFIKRYADKSLIITPQLKEFAAHGGRGYVISHIMDHRYDTKSRQWEVLVRWESFDDEPPTWQPLQRTFADAPTVITGYLKLVTNAADKLKLTKAIQALRK